MDAAEYETVVLGLIFLKYISDAFEGRSSLTLLVLQNLSTVWIGGCMFIGRESFVKVPVVGGLAYCRWKDLWKTFAEIIPKFVVAALPVFVSAVVLSYAGNNLLPFPDNITKNFENGELYLFCTSMLSTIFYIAIKEREDDKPGFPNKSTHMLFVLVLIVTSSIVFALKRAGVTLNPTLLIDLSYWFLMSAFVMVVLATTINNGLNSPNPIAFQKKETDDFLEQLKKHRKQT